MTLATRDNSVPPFSTRASVLNHFTVATAGDDHELRVLRQSVCCAPFCASPHHLFPATVLAVSHDKYL